jgi:hypothetical protein
MDSIRTMSWTCPGCLARNTRPIADDTPHGKLLPVRCESCRTERFATAVLRPQPGQREPVVYGVPWV